MAAASRQPVAAPATLQDVAATPGLGGLIMGELPLPERVRLRGLCRAFKSSVDASLQCLREISASDMSDLDRKGRSDGCALRWLAGKCNNLEVLEAGNKFGRCPLSCWRSVPFADAILAHMAARCRNLQSLHLRGCNGVGNAALRAVAENCGELRHLDIYDCRSVTDAGVSAIATACRQLEHLDVGGAMRVTDDSILVVASHCPRLQHLGVACTLISDVGLSAIAAGCCGLEYLDMGHAFVTDASLRAVASHCPRLEQLYAQGTLVGNTGITAIAQQCSALRVLGVTGCKFISNDGIVAVAENCPRLEAVDFDGTFAVDPDIATAAMVFHCSQLRQLCIELLATDAAVRLDTDSCRQLLSLRIRSRQHFTEAAAVALASHCSQLRSLTLGDCLSATDATLSAFAASCPLLEELSLLSSHKVSDVGILAVSSHCSRLQSVRLWGCQGVTDVSTVELVKNSPGLRVLDLAVPFAGHSTVIAAGQHCPDLRSLYISPCAPSVSNNARRRSGADGSVLDQEWPSEDEVRVRDDALACVLRNCLKLEKLNLQLCQGLSDAGIAMTGESCKRLRELSLGGCRGCFTPQGLAAMAPNLGALETLYAPSCDAVTDVSVVALAEHCPRLSFVEVYGCGMGDPGIVALAKHCSLVTLRVSECEGVTDAGMVAMGELSPPLDELVIRSCRGVTGPGIVAVASKCKGLRFLEILGCEAVKWADIAVMRDMCPQLAQIKYSTGIGLDCV
eukprot:jgi/Mesvir1/20921/Mv07992-RA.1